MDIYIAQEAGFCFGVKRALGLIDKMHEEGRSIQIFGELIHNRAVLDELARKGIESIASLDDWDQSKTLVIRTHGIPEDQEKRLNLTGGPWVDATCPLVKKIHEIVKTIDADRFELVIVGDEAHPEVMASRSYSGRAVVVNSETEAERLEPGIPRAVVAQTTLDGDFFARIVEILRRRSRELEVYDTICSATRVRQQAVKELAPNVDCLVVIGGKNSSNTKKLVEIARERNPHAFHVESSQGLDALVDQIFSRPVQRLGIAAGASTPPAEIERVKSFFNAIICRSKESAHGQRRT
jgi:4-hydroxy-3-methylbut-2-enyl diphosphate reductase